MDMKIPGTEKCTSTLLSKGQAVIIPSLLPTTKLAKVVTVTLTDSSNATNKSVVKSLQPDGKRTVTNVKSQDEAPVEPEITINAYEESTVSSERSSSSHSPKKEIGLTITVEKPVAKGAYGSVFTATDEFENRLAVKKLPTDKNGVPCLMEASIMSTVIHPFISQAVRLHCDTKLFYIMSELAISDLSKYTRKDKTGHVATIEELSYWSSSLCIALACLHKMDIVHADVKASNILLFPDNSIKLTDFTLSVKLWEGVEYRHTVATCTHRAPEVWDNKIWSKPIDIWALGCTLYEIAYGQSLFPFHADAMNGEQETNQLKEQTIASINDWVEKTYNLPSTNKTTTFQAVTYPSSFHNEEYKQFNDFLLSMLKIKPEERSTALQLLHLPFVEKYRPPTINYGINSKKEKRTNRLSERDLDRIRSTLRHYTDNSMVIEHAIKLYIRTIPMRDIDDVIKQLTCLWISGKLILRQPIVPSDQPACVMLSAERDICRYLNFQLHN